MRIAIFIVLAFGFLVWDLERNNGHYTNEIQSSLTGLLQGVGLY
jgi:hypothetical protein